MERNLSLPAMQCHSKRSSKGWFSKDLLFGRGLAIWTQYFQMMFKNDAFLERNIVVLPCFEKRAVC